MLVQLDAILRLRLEVDLVAFVMELDPAEVGDQAGDPLAEAELHRRKREPLGHHPAGQLRAVFPGDRHLDSRHVKVHLAAGDGDPGVLD